MCISFLLSGRCYWKVHNLGLPGKHVAPKTLSGSVQKKGKPRGKYQTAAMRVFERRDWKKCGCGRDARKRIGVKWRDALHGGLKVNEYEY